MSEYHFIRAINPLVPEGRNIYRTAKMSFLEVEIMEKILLTPRL